MKLIRYWFEWCERFDSLVVRERLLLFGSCLAGIYLLFDTVLILPATNDQQRLSREIEALEGKIEQISSEKQVFDRVSQRDPDANIKREQLKLQGRLLQLEGQLDDLSLRLVPAERLPEVLQSVSEKAQELNLKSLETLKPEIINLGGIQTRLSSIANAAKDMVDGESEVVVSEKVYRHGIKIHLEADYFSIIDFLKSLEDLPWRFYWEGIDYKVKGYPYASVHVELYTLSTSEGVMSE